MRAAIPLPYAPPQMNYTLLGSYVLSADFTVSLGGRSWTVPAGYRTDLATVPRIFWWAIPPTGAYEIAAVLHDWMITDGIAAGLVTSREADAAFRELMRLAGVGVVTRWCMWAAVRTAAPLSRHRRPSGFWLDAPGVLAITAAVLTVARYVLLWADRAAHSLAALLT